MQKLVWQNANGVELDLTSGNYGITEWEGFSNASLNIQQQQVPFQDGGVFLDALIEQRELTITLAMQDKNNLEERYRQRRELISALNPKLGEGYLIYTNDFISKRIKCVPQIPIFETHNSDTAGTPKASLSWTACEPYWEDLEETTVVLENGVQNGDLYTNTSAINYTGDVETGIRIEVEAGAKQYEIIKTNEGQIKKIKLETPDFIFPSFEINTNVGQKTIKGLCVLTEENAMSINVENAFIDVSYSHSTIVQTEEGFIGIGAITGDESNILVFKSANTNTWEHIATINQPYSDKTYLFIDQETGVLYISNSTSSNVFVSSDNGVNWTTGGAIEGNGNRACFKENTKTVFRANGVCVYNKITKEVCELGNQKMIFYRNGGTVEIEKPFTFSVGSGSLTTDERGNYYILYQDMYYAYSEITDCLGTTMGYAGTGVWGYPIDGKFLSCFFIPYSRKTYFALSEWNEGQLESTMAFELAGGEYQAHSCCAGTHLFVKQSENILAGNILEATEQSMIKYMSNNSDMSIYLKKGNNNFVVNYEKAEGYNVKTEIKYRQKYIGV